MDISGRTMIFKNDYGYSIAISNKNQEGKYDKMYITAQIPKNMELENKTLIEVTKGFLSFYKTKNGLPKIKVVIQEYNLEKKDEEIDGVYGDDLPF